MRLKHLFIIFISAFLCLPVSSTSQQNKGVLDPENNNEARLSRLLPPKKIIDAVGVTQGMVVAEIGAGRGRFAVHLAVRAGDSGKVYAEDIDESALRHLENRCKKWGLDNVEAIRGKITDPMLPAGELDLIFVVSSYHHFKDPVSLMRNARPALKADGRLAIAEWQPWNEDDREGTTSEDLETQMMAAGYRLVSTTGLDVSKPLNIYIFRSVDE